MALYNAAQIQHSDRDHGPEITDLPNPPYPPVPATQHVGYAR